jgi:hypothetical protein
VENEVLAQRLVDRMLIHHKDHPLWESMDLAVKDWNSDAALDKLSGKQAFIIVGFHLITESSNDILRMTIEYTGGITRDIKHTSILIHQESFKKLANNNRWCNLDL